MSNSHCDQLQIYMYVCPRVFIYTHDTYIYTMYICIYIYLCVHDQSYLTLYPIAHQAPLSMEVSRQEYWSGLPFPSPGDFPNPGIEVMSLASPALAGFFTTEPPGKSTYTCSSSIFVYVFIYIYMLPWWLSSKGSACNAGDVGSLISGSGGSPGERNGKVFLLGKSHEQGSLAGYSPWGCKGLDTT